MEINWEYLTVPVGKHWADKYINYPMINRIMRDGWGAISWKKGGFKDPGMKDYRFATAGGNLRPLLGSSVKIEKDDGSGAFVRVLYLSPSKESSLPLDLVFPKKWSPGRACFERVPIPKYRLNPQTALVCQNCGLPISITPHRNNPPLAKPLKFKYEEGINSCSAAGSCKFTCITTSGQMTQQQRTRYAKTWYFMTEPIVFLRQILTEIYIYAQEAYINQLLFYCRLNGTSDIPWEYLISMDEMTEDVQGLGGFYDYTKLSWTMRGGRFWKKHMGNTAYPRYYHLTFSLDEKKTKKYREYLKMGYGVSVVTPEKTVKQLLRDYASHPEYKFMIDGDITDFRFADPIRAIVLLKSKGDLVKKSTARRDQYDKYLRWTTGKDTRGKASKKQKLKPWERREFNYLKVFFGRTEEGAKTQTDFDRHLEMELDYLHAKKKAFQRAKQKLPGYATARLTSLDPTSGWLTYKPEGKNLHEKRQDRLDFIKERGCFDFENDYLMTKAFRQIHGGKEVLPTMGCGSLSQEQPRPVTMEQDYSYIVGIADEIVHMDRTDPLYERPNLLEKPTAFAAQAVGIAQAEGNTFYDLSTPFYDLPAYDEAQVGRYSRKELAKKKEKQEAREKAARAAKKGAQAQAKVGQAAAEYERKLAVLNRYVELKQDSPSMTKTAIARDIGISVGSLNTILKKRSELQMSNPRESQLPAGMEEFGFDVEETETSPDPNYEALINLERGDKFTIGNRKPVFRVTGAPDNIKRGTVKVAVIEGTAERKYYIVSRVDLDHRVGAFEAIGGTFDHVKSPRGGKTGFVHIVSKKRNNPRRSFAPLHIVTPSMTKLELEERKEKVEKKLGEEERKQESWVKRVMAQQGWKTLTPGRKRKLEREYALTLGWRDLDKWQEVYKQINRELKRNPLKKAPKAKYAEYDRSKRQWVVTDGDMVYDIDEVYTWEVRGDLERDLEDRGYYLDSSKQVMKYR